MLLKKTLNRFVLKKNPKKNDKPANALAPWKKGAARLFRLRSRRAVLLLLFHPGLRRQRSLGVVNNLSDFIFSLIRAIGLILLGWGVVQVGLSFQSHDPSQRSQGFLTLAGGLVITFAKEILDLITA